MVFAGRDRELRELSEKIEESFREDTRLIVVVGEAGVGKTTLVRKTLENIDAAVAVGEYLPEDEGDYSGFIKALQQIGLENTLGYIPAPDIQALMVTDESGLLLAWAGREVTVDPDIFTSMLSAVGMFVADSLAPVSRGGEYLKELKYGDYTLYITSGIYTLVGVLKGTANEYFLGDLG